MHVYVKIPYVTNLPSVQVYRFFRFSTTKLRCKPESRINHETGGPTTNREWWFDVYTIYASRTLTHRHIKSSSSSSYLSHISQITTSHHDCAGCWVLGAGVCSVVVLLSIIYVVYTAEVSNMCCVNCGVLLFWWLTLLSTLRLCSLSICCFWSDADELTIPWLQ